MNGDFTRKTFRPEQHYWAVLTQQGRVDVDADETEQVHINRHLDVTGTADLIGRTGGPEDVAGFQVTLSGGGLLIGAGRYYVDGRLCENDQLAKFMGQPDDPGEAEPSGVGAHLAYLDVWDRHVTSLDDPHLREVALGGPDTSTRAKTVWQVRTQPIDPGNGAIGAAVAALSGAIASGDPNVDRLRSELLALLRTTLCDAPPAPVGGSLTPGSGTLSARTTAAPPAASDPCRFEPGGGYRRLENRLYRVEIHRAGSRGDATPPTYLWSRANGSIVVSVEEFRNTGLGTQTTGIEVRGLGLDSTQQLRKGDLIEIASDDLINAGEPGQLAEIDNDPDPSDNVLVLTTAVDIKASGLHPQVRRWDGQGVVDDTAQELEDGIEAAFSAGSYAARNYWQIPARANTADIEWPPFPEYPGHEPAGPPASVPPDGIEHRFASLAAVIHDGTGLVEVLDLRDLFAAATERLLFDYVGGDGQEPVLPSGEIPQPLQVSVTSAGGTPAAGREVYFEVVAGGGTVADSFSVGPSMATFTDAQGIASVDWTVDLTEIDHRVAVTLIPECPTGAPIGPIIFNSHVNHKLHYLSGDGQDWTPGGTVKPLRVWASNGRWPMNDATVRFTVTEGGGTLSATEVATGPDGVADTEWTLDGSTLRQQVEALLLDADGNPVHDASICFNATIRRATEVEYTPAGDCFLTVNTVQDALDALCRVEREAGGGCTISIKPGNDVGAIFAMIPGRPEYELNICFAEGEYLVKEPLVVGDLDHVTVSGVGPGTRLVAHDQAAVLEFSKCGSVTVRDLHLDATTRADTTAGTGVLFVLDCGATEVSNVGVSCTGAEEELVTGIFVDRTDGGPEHDAPVRIAGCDVVVGSHQHGIAVKSALSRDTSPAVSVEHCTIRGGFEPQAIADLVKFLDFEDLDRSIQVLRERGDDREVIVLEDLSVAFASAVPNSTVWTEEVARLNPTTPAEARRVVRRLAGTIVKDRGQLGLRRVFRTWFDGLDRSLALRPARSGIDLAGFIDATVAKNVISGMTTGIFVEPSPEGESRPMRSAVITGNTIDLPTPSDGLKGVVVTSVESVVVSENLVRSDGGEESVGLSMTGVFGRRMVISSNEFAELSSGIVIDIKNPEPAPAVRQWVASENIVWRNLAIVDMKPCLEETQCKVRDFYNVPPRLDDCPDDRAVIWPPDI